MNSVESAKAGALDALRRDDTDAAFAILAALSTANLKQVAADWDLTYPVYPRTRKGILDGLPSVLAQQSKSGRLVSDACTSATSLYCEAKWISERIGYYVNPPRKADGSPETGPVTHFMGWRNPYWIEEGYTEAEEHARNLRELRDVEARILSLSPPEVPHLEWLHRRIARSQEDTSRIIRECLALCESKGMGPSSHRKTSVKLTAADLPPASLTKQRSNT